MSTHRDTRRPQRPTANDTDDRARLLSGIAVTERRINLAGVSTAVLEGGDGPPIVLLHGPGESAVNWRWVIPDLVETHRVVAPDLPAHGSSSAPDNPNGDGVVAWLGELLDQTCDGKPVVVGHVLGGAIAARFAAGHSQRLRHLVLVDTLGLAPFRPSPRFAAAFAGFQARKSEASYTRFMRQCAFDLDALREDMREDWEPFASYNLTLARGSNAKAAGRLFRKAGLPRIPSETLDRISVPTTLIWGRHDRANRLRVPEAASARYGWPLEVIENAADDPPRDQPAAFVQTLRSSIAGS